MKKKLMKKIWSGLLLSAMMVGVLQTGIEPMTVHAAATIKTMNLDTAYLAPSDGKWDKASDHKVYFGKYGGTPTAFRVLKSGSSTMMLDCDTILLDKKFDEDGTANDGQSGGNPNGWVNSDLEVWLNGNEYYDNSSVFTSVEKSAIASTTLSGESNYEIELRTFIDYAAADHVYLLSAREAETFYNSESERKKTSNSDPWWLRSAGTGGDPTAGRVSSNGKLTEWYVNYALGVSPVLNLNRSSVLFTSANTVNKSSALTEVGDGSSIKEWKLTLLDTGKTVAVPDGQSVTKSGNTVTVPYTYTGSDVSQISVMITSGAYDAAGTEILYYGKLDTTLAASGANGTGTFTLPNGLPENYKMYILAEDVNGEKVTDYASAPAEISISIPETTEDIPAIDDTTPSITNQPQNASVKEGETATFTVTATGTAPLSYQWMINRNDGNGWVNIDGATLKAYTTSATDMDCNGFRYKCKVTNAKGSEESNAVTLTVTKASAETQEYHITEGANQSIAENYDGTITIKADGERAKFVSVSVDGTVVDTTNYTVKSDSTIVTFTKDYLDTLSVGNHTVRFTYTDGYSETTLTITKAATQPEENDTSDTTEVTTANTDTNKDEAPKTGDGTPVKVCAMLAMIAGLFCLILFLVNRRRNFH